MVYIARMKLHEHMQNVHQDHVEFWNSEHGQEVAGGMLMSYNTQTVSAFVHAYIFADF